MTAKADTHVRLSAAFMTRCEREFWGPMRIWHATYPGGEVEEFVALDRRAAMAHVKGRMPDAVVMNRKGWDVRKGL